MISEVLSNLNDSMILIPFTKREKCYFLCKVSTQSAFASIWGRGCFLHISVYHCMLLSCWYGTPHKTSVNSLNDALFFPTHAIKKAKRRAPSRMLHSASQRITLNSQGASEYPVSHTSL